MSGRPENYPTHALGHLEDPAHGIRVPVTRIAQDDSPTGAPNPPLEVYRTAGTGCEPEVGLAPMRSAWILGREGVSPYQWRGRRLGEGGPNDESRGYGRL